MSKITKILIANRGEIACRVMETARDMGIRTVAVYSDADAGALHVGAADEAVHIGPAPAAESYLVIDKIIKAAKDTGADAIHPGYGFLSENAKFADACRLAGLTFIGPSVDSIESMGLKDSAKALMEKANVPIVPGYHDESQDEKTLEAEARKIGYPLLIKAVAGGGGKGMRMVEGENSFKENLVAAKREAKAAFGDDRVLIEKYLQKSRHIEVQVFGDSHGNVVHLFERDCSLQRRHQKVIEEAPAPGVSPEMRAKMGEAAVNAAKATNYVGAGTVEFIVDVTDGVDNAPFYFMEMNTRLQVEHPVTEMITCLDLVEWQVRVAEGEELPLKQDEITMTGHAVEARLYAEDPDNDFLPTGGTLKRFRTPVEEAGIRVETGIAEGDDIPIHYDPMIAKLVAHGGTRDDALRKLADALKATRIAGATTNLAFLAKATEHPAFIAAEIDTGFIPRHEADLLGRAEPTETDALIAALALHLEQHDAAEEILTSSTEIGSPWNTFSGWRMNLMYREEFALTLGGTDFQVIASTDGSDRSYYWQWVVNDNDPKPCWGANIGYGELVGEIDGDELSVGTLVEDHAVTVMRDAETLTFRIVGQGVDEDTPAEGPGAVTAPMPGKILKIMTTAGESVEAGDALIIMEAMKMEYTLTAPRHGTVGEIMTEADAQVTGGALLLTVSE